MDRTVEVSNWRSAIFNLSKFITGQDYTGHWRACISAILNLFKYLPLAAIPIASNYAYATNAAAHRHQTLMQQMSRSQ